jgi:hypothetical protein
MEISYSDTELASNSVDEQNIVQQPRQEIIISKSDSSDVQASPSGHAV